MDWKPTAEHERALDAVAQWIREGSQQVFRLFGYAGTGKTTLAKYFAQGVRGQVYFAAFTGKAAYVLTQKGCAASTIHSLIYVPKNKSRATLIELQDLLLEVKSEFLQKGMDPPEIEKQERVIALKKRITEENLNMQRPMFSLNLDSPLNNASLLVVDEVSMVDEQMGKDLEKFGCPILVLGDPGQLPPVFGTGYFTKQDPDFMLEEPHRTAKDSPIIQLATQVRKEQKLTVGDYGHSKVIKWNDITKEDALAADQIIVGTHKLRRAMNRRMRDLLGLTTLNALPTKGDRLVCLRNDHDVGFLNGSIWECENAIDTDDDRVALEVLSEDKKRTVACEAHVYHFREQDVPFWDKLEAQEFDYGYALTCHKSQGSSWDDVLVFDESKTFRQHRHKWLYTAITRAAEAVTVVMK